MLMGKKKPGRPKGSGKKSKKTDQHVVPSGFWSQVFAILLFVVAVLLLVGLGKTGGDLLTNASDTVKLLLGYTAWIVPFIFIWQGVQIFRRENNKLPTAVWVCTILFLAIFSGLFQLMAVDPTSRVFEGAGGGIVGWFMDHTIMGSAVKPQIEATVLAFIYVVLLLLLSMFVLAVSPKELFAKIGEFFSRESDADKNNKKVIGKLAAKEPDHEMTIKGAGIKEEPRKLSRKEMRIANKAKPAEVATPTQVVVNNSNWKFPAISLLSSNKSDPDPGDIKGNAKIIENTLAEFGIEGTVEGANVGPRVTQYLLSPQSGVKLSKISNMEDEFRKNLSVESIRIEAPIPGQRFVGIEVPNKKSAFVNMRSILETPAWVNSKDPLSFAVGLDISGKPIVSALDKLPHLLIAGTTGSGKSVMMNVLLASLLYRNTPDQLKMVLIDPKGNEMASYADMPHLAAPIIAGTSHEELHKLNKTLAWTVGEMEKRYKIFSERRVKNIADFNAKFPDEKLPYLVIVADEYTDLIDSTKAQEREQLTTAFQRIAQKGRASGIHEVIMMQAPRAKYIQGPLKANIPAGFAFAVRSKMESQQIINQSGGEQLMGKGDMLMINQQLKEPRRVQAAVVEDEEVEKIVDFLKKQSEPQYDNDLLAALENTGNGSGGEFGGGGNDPEYQQAVQTVINAGKASTSLLQRKLRIGYGKASRIIEEMEENGVIGPADGARPREVLISSLSEVTE